MMFSPNIDLWVWFDHLFLAMICGKGWLTDFFQESGGFLSSCPFFLTPQESFHD